MTVFYKADLLNKYSLFQKLSNCLSARDDIDLPLHINKFLYRASCVLHAYEEIINSVNTSNFLASNYIEQISFGDDNKIHLSSTSMFDAYYAIPVALNNLRVMQNMLPRHILTIGHKALDSIPKSISDVMKNPSRYFDSNLALDNLNLYWSQGGDYIRDLRNIDNHYDVLIEKTYIMKVNESAQVKIFLPDNPSEKSPRQFVYNRHNNALDVIKGAIDDLNTFVNNVLPDIEAAPFTLQSRISHVKGINTTEDKSICLIINPESFDDETQTLKINAMEGRQRKPENTDGNAEISFRRLNPDCEVINAKS